MSDIHGAVGSYVVDALDDGERHEFEDHLAVCEACTQEVQEFTETAAELSSLYQAAPPPELRASVLAGIRNVRPLPPLEDEQERAATVVPLSPRRVAAEAPPVVDELALARQRRATRMLSFAVAAAMVVILAMGGWALNLNRQLETQTAGSTAEQQLLSAADAKWLVSSLPDGGHASYVVSEKLNTGLLIGDNMPDLASGKGYQLWTVHDGKAIPYGNRFPGGKNTKVGIGNVAGAETIAITIEDKDGATVPNLDTIMGNVNL